MLITIEYFAKDNDNIQTRAKKVLLLKVRKSIQYLTQSTDKLFCVWTCRAARNSSTLEFAVCKNLVVVLDLKCEKTNCTCVLAV